MSWDPRVWQTGSTSISVNCNTTGHVIYRDDVSWRDFQTYTFSAEYVILMLRGAEVAKDENPPV